MRAISLWQPWASAMVIGAKRIETRHWYTPYRGPIAIHSAKKKDAEVSDHFYGEYFHTFRSAGITRFDALPFGCVLLTCRLTRCVPTADVRDSISGTERLFGNYSNDRFAWVFEDIEVLPEPVPAKGAQGFWNWEQLPPLPDLFS